MLETTQGHLGLDSTHTQTNLSFQSVLDYIREHAQSEHQK